MTFKQYLETQTEWFNTNLKPEEGELSLMTNYFEERLNKETNRRYSNNYSSFLSSKDNRKKVVYY